MQLKIEFNNFWSRKYLVFHDKKAFAEINRFGLIRQGITAKKDNQVWTYIEKGFINTSIIAFDGIHEKQIGEFPIKNIIQLSSILGKRQISPGIFYTPNANYKLAINFQNKNIYSWLDQNNETLITYDMTTRIKSLITSISFNRKTTCVAQIPDNYSDIDLTLFFLGIFIIDLNLSLESIGHTP
ncbi:MAG: hypothetical protein BroJett025_07870 [Patescibacteria group bacterium]|nr:MAG: hypothetical protein BroJett025_07870 [Patescibacteria group bacterium]